MRLPLPIRLMASYLLVAGLIFVPVFVHLRSTLAASLRAAAREDLDAQLSRVRDRLAATPPERLADAARELAALSPQRLTVMDAGGRVLADSLGALPGGHGDRPEVRLALSAGYGVAERVSATTGRPTLYAAMRWPAGGPARGVARLAAPLERIDRSVRAARSVAARAGAVSLSAAVLLSLVAALAFSRPLRRLVEGARAFAAGDFGHRIDVTSRDELGEAAQALVDLAAQLRGRLVASGADRATLHALLDDLPVGVVLFDRRGAPLVVSARARELCGFVPRDELEQARALPALPDQARAVERALREGGAVETALELPWRPGARLAARWVPVYSPEGDHQPALVVSDEPVRRARAEAAGAALLRAAERLREASRRLGGAEGDAPLAAALARAAADAEREAARESAPPRADAVRVLELSTLVAGALEDVRALAEAGGVRLESELAQPAVRVVEAEERSRRALRHLLGGALEGVPRGAVLVLRGRVEEASVRLSVRRPGGPPPAFAPPEDGLGALGGSSGMQQDADGTELWVALPRA